jgi:methionine--tRNA ligase beta chain
MNEQINIDYFSKIEIRVGLVVEAENVEKSEKLIRLKVDFKEFERIIFTGVRGYGYEPEDFLNKQFLFVTNLEYRRMMGEESQGMILAVGEDKPLFISAEGLPVGSKVR